LGKGDGAFHVVSLGWFQMRGRFQHFPGAGL
jgi:hypothetical protein